MRLISCIGVILLLIGSVWCDPYEVKLHISAPDIYPTDEIKVYPGSITVVLIANARECSTRYTVDGSVPSLQSREYTTPLHFFVPGNITITAVSFPTDLRAGWRESVVVSRTFTVGRTAVAAPVMTPTRYRFRVGDVVQLAVPHGLELHTQLFTASTHTAALRIAGDVPGNFSHSPATLCAVPCFVHFPHPGVAVLRAVALSLNDDVPSPVAQWSVAVTPALAYEVSTECAACAGRPTVGEWFTVWLQGASRAASHLMLTTSSQGCHTQRQVLDDTGVVDVEPHKLGFRFRTYGDPATVWVCLDEDSDGHFGRLVLRDGRANFTVQAAVREVHRPSGRYTPVPAPVTLAPVTVPTFLSRSRDSGWRGVAGLVVLASVFIGLVVVAVRVARARGVVRSERRHRIPDDDESAGREELSVMRHVEN